MFAARVTVDLSGFRSLRGVTMARLGHECEDVADAGADASVDDANSSTAFRDRTGALRRSITVKSTARFDGTKALATIAAGAPYAGYVEWGTSQHWIRPRMARSFVGPTNAGQNREKRKPHGRGNAVPGRLTFYSAKLGRWISTLEVWHPGNSARLYMHDGTRHGVDVMIRTVRGPVAKRLGALWR
jgi:hypothetical protein